MNRRTFLRTAAGLLVAAPAIVRASSLMPVRPVVDMRGIVFPQLPPLDQVLARQMAWIEASVQEAVLYGTGPLAERFAPRVVSLPLRELLVAPAQPRLTQP